MLPVVTRALSVAAIVLLLAACTASPTASGTPSATPRPTTTASAVPSASSSATPTPIARLTPLEAADVLRKNITGVRPLLLLNGVPDDWSAEVRLEAPSSFAVTYRDPATAKLVSLTVAAVNPPLPGPNAKQSHPSFHGVSALYQIADGTDAQSDRLLLWTEPGEWTAGPRGVPYYLVGSGMTDAEFWQLANSLHPNQI